MTRCVEWDHATAIDWAHDALGRRTQLQRSNGVATTYNYDPASRLLGMTHAKGSTVLEQLAQGFDQADNKTQVNQLIQTATALPPAVTAAYDAVNAQTQFNSTTAQTLGYDPNGNLASDGTNLYVWDARNRLIGISGGTSATFSYDALDRRMTKSLNGATSTYHYDGADVVTEAGATNASYLSTLNIDEPIVRQTSSGNEFYLTNDLGSTLALTDDSGAVTTNYTYGPFGTTSVNGSSTNPVQFTGRENDGTGLYYYRARYYSPSHGRFLAEDPLEFGAGDANLYAYVFNNPTNFTDPTGEFVQVIAIACLRGAVQSAGQDLLIGLAKRKIDGRNINIDWDGAARSCLSGGFNAGKALANLTSRAARRAALRQQGISTSRPAVSQSGTNGQRQLIVTGPNGKPNVVTQHLPDAQHPNPHWHAAPAKTTPDGQVIQNRYGQAKYQNGGSVVQY